MTAGLGFEVKTSPDKSATHFFIHFSIIFPFVFALRLRILYINDTTNTNLFQGVIKQNSQGLFSCINNKEKPDISSQNIGFLKTLVCILEQKCSYFSFNELTNFSGFERIFHDEKHTANLFAFDQLL